MKLSEDYLAVDEITMEWEYFAESPAMVKRGSTYYIFGSHLTGWNPNDNVSRQRNELCTKRSSVVLLTGTTGVQYRPEPFRAVD